MNKLEKLTPADIIFTLEGNDPVERLRLTLNEAIDHITALERDRDRLNTFTLALIQDINKLESGVELLKKHFGNHIFPPNHTTTPPIMETDKQ